MLTVNDAVRALIKFFARPFDNVSKDPTVFVSTFHDFHKLL